MTMNKRSILFFPISVSACVLCSAQALAAVPAVDGKGIPAVATCAPTVSGTNGAAVLHFDKIIFMITGKLVAANSADQPALDAVPLNTELDIKVKDNPKTVADLKGKVLTFLGALPNSTAAAPNQNRSSIQIINVEYAVVCAP